MAKQKMSLSEAIAHFQKCMSNVQIGRALGVTPDQVYKYSTGYTATCGDSVVDAFYDKLDVLIDYYTDEETYLKIREVRDE